MIIIGLKNIQKHYLIPTFWGHNQFGHYILVVVNLVLIIFNLQSIWSLPITANRNCLRGKWCPHLAHMWLIK